MVDTVVSTIGFPLVGGPAGTMEGGRQAEVAKAILEAKQVPYIVAAPLLIQVSKAISKEQQVLSVAAAPLFLQDIPADISILF